MILRAVDHATLMQFIPVLQKLGLMTEDEGYEFVDAANDMYRSEVHVWPTMPGYAEVRIVSEGMCDEFDD